ncbi:signal recognition particle subunit [Coemansia brasiliensis]|uniref:Signal recognition particle subunit n=1 Tax=Coemansia brasiliensis TaxID=2650707 RepID=A0A9W8LWT2_9FUNG|nr:signal recognition particle subunit [Coemansia brasiliensis]
MDVDDMDFPLPEDTSPALAQPTGGIRIGQSLGGMKVVNDASQFKKWVCLYPIYFDKSLSLEKGRKVPIALAVDSPFGRQISMAVKQVGLHVCFEPNKTHPRDFFRPGRVRVKLFDEQGRPMRPDIPNRKVLLRKVAEAMPLVDAPREKEPTLQDLIDQGALPALPGVPPPGMGSAEEASTSGTKPSKKPKAKKKGKAKTIV